MLGSSDSYWGVPQGSQQALKFCSSDSGMRSPLWSSPAKVSADSSAMSDTYRAGAQEKVPRTLGVRQCWGFHRPPPSLSPFFFQIPRFFPLELCHCRPFPSPPHSLRTLKPFPSSSPTATPNPPSVGEMRSSPFLTCPLVQNSGSQLHGHSLPAQPGRGLLCVDPGAGSTSYLPFSGQGTVLCECWSFHLQSSGICLSSWGCWEMLRTNLGSGGLCKCSISHRPSLRCWLKMKVIKHASLIYLACFISSIMKYNYPVVTYILWSNAPLGVFMNIIAPIQARQWWGSSHLL